MTASYLAQLQNNPGWFAINVLVPVLPLSIVLNSKITLLM
jgi:hypothetical protein